MRSKVLHAPPDLDLFASDRRGVDASLSRRVNADPENLERGLAQLVLTIVELLRQLMERQAVRRMDDGSLSDDEVERLALEHKPKMLIAGASSTEARVPPNTGQARIVACAMPASLTSIP